MLISPTYLYRKLKKSSCQKPMDRFKYNSARMFLWWPSTKVIQAVMIRQKTWSLGDRGLFSLYIHIEKFKIRNNWTEFNVTCQECCFGDLLPRLFKLSWFVKKHGPQGVRGLFSIYICIENFKILLVKYSLTHFSIAWLECCFGDPLLRFFNQS